MLYDKNHQKKKYILWFVVCLLCVVVLFLTSKITSGSPNGMGQICDLIYSFAVLHSDQQQCSDVTNRSADNAGKWFMVMRKCISCHFEDTPVILGLHGIPVEGDETCLTQHYKYGVGSHPSRARWIMGLKERKPGRKQRHIYVGRSRSRAVIVPVILMFVVMGAVIFTDMYRAYWTLGELGYQHSMVNHSIEFINAYDHTIHTETIEGNFKHLKLDINRGSGVRTQYIQLYLDEFDFRQMYLRKNKRESWFIVARLLAKYGHRALQWVNNLNNHHW